MKTGRSPAWLLDADAAGPIRFAVVDVDDQGRFVVPARLAEALTWFKYQEGGECLVKLLDGGCAQVSDWLEVSPGVLETRQALAAEANATPSRRHRLLQFDMTYARAAYEAKGRVRLPRLVTVHLVGESVGMSNLFLIVENDRLELWSPSYQQAFMSRLDD